MTLRIFGILVLLTAIGSSCSTIRPDTPPSPRPIFATSLPLPTATSRPTPTASPVPEPSPTATPHQSPGLIATLGETDSPWKGPYLPAFSPDGHSVVLAGTTVRMWDTQSLEQVRDFPNPTDQRCSIGNVAFSPDGALLAASYACWAEEGQPGHLLVWDSHTGKLLSDWLQSQASLIFQDQQPYSIPTTAFAFVPGSSLLALGSGTTIEIRDPKNTEPPIVFSLGDNMYATEISIRDDGQFLYVLMEWDKLNDFPYYWATAFRLQIWGLQTRDLRRVYDFPDSDYPKEGMELLGPNLVHYYYPEARAEVTDLTTDTTRDFVYRLGWKYYSPDSSYMAIARYRRIDPAEQGIEVWRVGTWRNLYTLRPRFGTDLMVSLDSIVFSPDNRTLAIAHDNGLSLWDIAPVVSP